jgi:hypothetical protein
MQRGDAGFLGIMVLLFLACVLRDPRSDTVPFRSFHPLPDAIEYAVGAANLDAGRGLTVTVNGHAIPSRYPPGFPLLIALAYRLLGRDLANAYYVSIGLGAAAIVLVFLLARALFREPGVARWSTFFLATSSLMLSFAPLVMTEVCSVFLALLALNLAVRYEPTRGVPGLMGLGLTLGFGILVRTANVLMIPPLVLYLGWVHGTRLRLRHWGTLLAPIAAAAGLLLLFNAYVFGSPFRDGYALYTPRTLFAWRFFAASALPYFCTLVLAHAGKTIWLQGPFYGPLVPLLAVLGLAALARAGRREVIGLATAWITLFYLFYASYFFYDFRFFLPVLPLVLLLAAIGLMTLLRRLAGATRGVTALAAIVLYLVQPIAGGTSPLAAARRNHATFAPPANYLFVQALNAYMEGIGAQPETHVVLTPLNLVYLDHYSNQRYTIAPLSRDQEYARVPELAGVAGPLDLDALLAAGRQVYLSSFAADDEEARAALDALTVRYRLEPVPAAGAALSRIVRKDA